MRSMIQESGWPAAVLLAAALFIAVVPAFRLQALVYPAARQVLQAKALFAARRMGIYETEHFTIRYTAADRDTVGMVALAAEAAYYPVTEALGYAPAGKAEVVIQPNQDELRRCFGWAGSENAMGVYWGGVIQVLSPHAWPEGRVFAQEFKRRGPMAHEFTHLVLDYLTEGNYPRWFTEGLAQHVDYQVTGYEWQTPGNHFNQPLYSMAQLEDTFDELPNQALAYRQSLQAVRYIAARQGGGALAGVLAELRRGEQLPAALQRAAGLRYSDLTEAWQP